MWELYGMSVSCMTDNRHHQHHHPAFDIDERALPQGVDLLEALVRNS